MCARIYVGASFLGCAIWLCLSALAWSQATVTAPQSELLSALQQAETQFKQGDLKAAIATLEPATTRAAATFGAEHRSAADFKIRLAELYDERLKLSFVPNLKDTSEKLLLEGIQIRERAFGRDHDVVLAALDTLSAHYTDCWDTTKAEMIYRQSLALRETRFGKDSVQTTRSLDGLGNLSRTFAKWQEAEDFFRRGLSIRQTKLGVEHPDVAISWIELGKVYSQANNYDAANSAFETALRLRTAKLDKNAPEIADVLEPLADHCRKREVNKADQSLAHNQRAVTIREAQWGKSHPKLVPLLTTLGTQWRERGQFSEAFVLLDRALQIKQDQLPENDLAVEQALRELANVAGMSRRWTDVGRLTEASLHKFYQREVQGTPSADLIEPVLRMALSLPLLARDQLELSNRSAEWLLNTRAVGRHQVGANLITARDRGDAQLQQKVQRLTALRNEWATTAMRLPTTGEEKTKWFSRVQQLQKQSSDLAREILAATAAATPATPWTSLEAIRRSVPENGVVVELARFRPFDPAAAKPLEPWGTTRYVAWIIPGKKSERVCVIDLGEARKIDTAVQSLRRAFAEAPSRIAKEGEPTAERLIRQELNAVGRLTLDPLLDAIGLYERWLIVPDSSLWFVPWCALSLPDGAYITEKHEVSYYSNGLDLLLPRGPDHKPSPPLIVADPDFEFAPPGTTARLATPPAAAKSTPNVFTDTGKALDPYRIPRVARLPGTASEAAAVNPAIKGFSAVTPIVVTGNAAREDLVKKAVAPHTLVLSTHGYFLADPPLDDWSSTESSAITAPLTMERTVFSSPLLRCGVLLAGCNRRQDNLPAGTEDGVLTGLEVLGLDLRGTELVVLSACETGLGQLQNSEGVSGLRQAFQLAGAKSVVATLWQIPDKQSAQLMTDFFGNLSAGQTKATALRNAQRTMIRARREKFAAAHPFHWAAFTLTGE